MIDALDLRGGRFVRDLCRTCVSASSEKSTYENFEIIVVRNLDFDPESSPSIGALSSDPRKLAIARSMDSLADPANFQAF